jgi:hypothetical protein
MVSWGDGFCALQAAFFSLAFARLSDGFSVQFLC